MKISATRYSLRGTWELVKRDVKTLFKSSRDAKDKQLHQDTLQQHPQVACFTGSGSVTLVGDELVAPGIELQEHNIAITSSGQTVQKDSTKNSAIFVKASQSQHHPIPLASTPDTADIDNAAQFPTKSKKLAIAKLRAASFRERVRYSARHIHVPSPSSLASYRSRPSTNSSKMAPSTATTIDEDHVANMRNILAGTTHHLPEVPNPPFPYLVADYALKAWYKSRPFDAKDRWVQRGVFLVLSAAFEYTPHNPLYPEVFGNGHFSTTGSDYERSNRRLTSLYWTLKGDRPGAVQAVECLLQEVYPEAQVRDLLLSFGDPLVDANIDELQSKLCTLLLPELSCL